MAGGDAEGGTNWPEQDVPWVIASVILGLGLGTFRLQGSSCSRSRPSTKNSLSAGVVWSPNPSAAPASLGRLSIESELLGYGGYPMKPPGWRF